MQAYIFHSDAGHGWLQVPLAEIKKLKIEDKISNYSYIDRYNEFAFLEEDDDLRKFLEEKKNRGEEYKIIENYESGESRIRRMRSFK
jgi:hypothetical protein